ncbi:VPLPA-CTERM sorting domain-containing protein [uncultured Jannaschia sp.]|uniref:VPLPA-CTERM sorting domain-containing protein n=1 Tax=uncultured Jannaschia sp. TaxID=293347 RepID=UPI00262ED35F|nr:VPLPA-CTERM sorting domain-containing protein [uncultured Jannaschia sp.]
MKQLRPLFAAAVIAMVALPAQAAPLVTYQYDYNTTFPESATTTFSQVFDWSVISHYDIQSLTFDLTFADTGPSLIGGGLLGPLVPLELWRANLNGGSVPWAVNSISRLLEDSLGVISVTFDATNNADVFADALGASALTFSLTEGGLNINDFQLLSASLTLDGTVVPLPAPFWLLGAGLLGLTAARRRRRTA